VTFEIPLQVGGLLRAQETWWHDPGHALPTDRGDEHQTGQRGDGGDMRAVGGQYQSVGLTEQMSENVPLQARVKVRFRLLHGQQCVLTVTILPAKVQPFQ
jgi:hypothetical protein